MNEAKKKAQEHVPPTAEEMAVWRQATEAVKGRDPLDAEGITTEILTDSEWVAFVLAAHEAMPRLLGEVARLLREIFDSHSVSIRRR